MYFHVEVPRQKISERFQEKDNGIKLLQKSSLCTFM
jgi:hypothetical protein